MFVRECRRRGVEGGSLPDGSEERLWCIGRPAGVGWRIGEGFPVLGGVRKRKTCGDIKFSSVDCVSCRREPASIVSTSYEVVW